MMENSATRNDIRDSNSSRLKGQPADPLGKRQHAYPLRSLLSSDPAQTTQVIPIFLGTIAAIEQNRLEGVGLCNLDPQKILIHDDGRVEISSARPLASGMTAVLGSLKYCAPEMVENTNGQPDRFLIESYVLGFVFYEIFLGRDLFEHQFEDVSGRGEFAWLTWHADRTKRADPLSNLIHGFPLILSNLIDTLMSKEEAGRLVDLRKISDAMDDSTQKTSIINLSAVNREEETMESVLRKVDALWRNVVDSAVVWFRNLSWVRRFPWAHR